MRSGNTVADFFHWVRGHLQVNHITIGVVVFVFGFFGAQISPAVGWLAFGFSLLLFTWELRMPMGVRAVLYLLAISPILYWFEQVSKLLFPHPGLRDATSTPELMFRFGFAATAVFGLLYVLRHRAQGRIQFAGGGQRQTGSHPAQQEWSNVPKTTFRNLGGMREEKHRIVRIVENRLYPEKSAKHGVVQNGILLYGPRGTGKTAIGEATAGEFKINHWYVNPNTFIQSRIGNSEENIREAFGKAYANRPILLFIDELDSIGTQRQQLGKNDDVGGAARAYNAIVTELMQCIDR